MEQAMVTDVRQCPKYVSEIRAFFIGWYYTQI